jgi:GNAT superfamily N-acetyltransferase
VAEAARVRRAAARNLADWHESWLGALHLACVRTELLWWCRDPAPIIYHGAVTLSPSSSELLAQVQELRSARRPGHFSLCDSWGDLSLEKFGFARFQTGIWMVRQPGPMRRVPPSELAVEEVRSASVLQTFESVSIDGFESSGLRNLGRFGLHAPGVLADGRMRLFAGRFLGRMVAVSMAYIGAEVVGVYGVATLPEYRGRGFGEALTWAATSIAPDLPAVLQPSRLGESTYRRMGYEELGSFTTWVHRGAPGRA